MSKIWKSLLDFGSNPGRSQTKPTEAASHQTKPTRLDPADRFNHSVGPEIVPPYDHEPNFCGEYVPNIKSAENLVELQQQLIVQLQQEISDMAKDTQEKEESPSLRQRLPIAIAIVRASLTSLCGLTRWCLRRILRFMIES